MRRLALALVFLLAPPALAQKSAPAPEAAPSGDVHLEYWTRTLSAHPLKLVRKNAARTLGKMGNRDAVPALISALKDPFQGVRVESAKALGLLGDERAFGPLRDALSDDTDREVRKAASDSVDKIKSYLEFVKQKEAKEQRQNQPD
jgi:HEAT repeat protein